MSRRREGQLFVGRIGKHARVRDLEDIFERYGRIIRCDIKYGAEMAYAFIDFEDRKDSEDAMRYENGRDICGSRVVVEWAKSNPRRPLGRDQCYHCQSTGHWARDCPKEVRKSGRSAGRYSHSPRRHRNAYSRRSRSPRRKRSRSRSDSRDHKRKRTRSRSRSRSRKDSRSNRQSKTKSRTRSRSRSTSRQRDQVNGGSRSPSHDSSRHASKEGSWRGSSANE